jgi:hypothetical protein
VHGCSACTIVRLPTYLRTIAVQEVWCRSRSYCLCPASTGKGSTPSILQALASWALQKCLMAAYSLGYAGTFLRTDFYKVSDAVRLVGKAGLGRYCYPRGSALEMLTHTNLQIVYREIVHGQARMVSIGEACWW